MESLWLKYNPIRELDTADRDLEINRDPEGDCREQEMQRPEGEMERQREQ